MVMYLDEFLNNNSTHLFNCNGLFLRSSMCLPVPYGNSVGNADVKYVESS